MPNFQYNALDGNGREVRGSIVADSRHEAIAQLAQKSNYVTDIVEAASRAAAATLAPAMAGAKAGANGSAVAGASGAGGAEAEAAPSSLVALFNKLKRGHVKPRQKAAMLAQLATAQEAGLPLLSALRVVEQQADSEALRLLMRDLATRVQGGESLSASMREHPTVFSRLETSMVSVGETAGVLDQVLQYIADFAERDLEIREKIKSASMYPVVVLCLAGVSLVVILTFILPSIMTAVAANAKTLPLPTRMMMGLSDFLRHWGWLLLVAGAGIFYMFRRWVSTPEGRFKFDTFKLKIPVFGQAVRRIAVARFARTLGTLSKSGIQILEALEVLRDTLGNEALARKIDVVRASITQGQSIAEPLRETGQFPPLLIQVISLGEKTGRLDELLLRAAGTYEKETTAAVQKLMAILPVILTVVLALIVLMVLLSVLLPIVMMETGGG